ncbi:GntR family transcriptional regulator [Calditerrivibrio nitroreducens]|uniref:Transcriptional regulator, GntR family n=1 Tax=Calditerrivibrio nitroreducens (strain DSM 19672 / NBRC 101217 / Yu37-1) TaxID=768670 RepID=E4TGM3_CALNY|nr:GntR family transcriptional regulator [Calditerrivibrio nitroreducens]ADR19736.1 transcriptional regulator, GntR family [Calditerrivibrio nitroreducens DSM 19672]
MKDINIDNTPLSEKIAETLRDYIMKGNLKPGERLTEPKLSAMLGISRTPIREALRLLENEGFIDIFPRRGAVVSDITAKDVDEIFVIKTKLESLAARLAVENISEADIKKMMDINEKMAKYSETKNVVNLIKLNAEFHNIFIEKSNNSRLIKFIESLNKQFKRVTAYSFTEAGRIKKVLEEHANIVDAFVKRDADRVEQLVDLHVKNGWQFIISRMNYKTSN